MVGITPSKHEGLADILERVLDKGIVIVADITVFVGDVELLGIKIRAAIASFETAAKYGLEFPAGTNLSAPGWKGIENETAYCPNCGKQTDKRELFGNGCPNCNWVSPLNFGKKQKQEANLNG